MLYATLVAKLPVHLSIPHRLGCIQYQSGYELWLSDKSNTIDRVHYVAMWKSFHIRLLFYVYGTKIIFLPEIYMPCRLRKWLHSAILRLSIYLYTWLYGIKIIFLHEIYMPCTHGYRKYFWAAQSIKLMYFVLSRYLMGWQYLRAYTSEN